MNRRISISKLGGGLRESHQLWKERIFSRLAAYLLKLVEHPSHSFQNSDAMIMQKAKKVLFRVQEKKVCVYRWGRGPKILFVHGWAGNATQVCNFVYPLVRKGFQVVAFDNIAHGNTKGTFVSLPQMAEVLQWVVQHYDGWHGVIGHCVGNLLLNSIPDSTGKFKRIVMVTPPLSFQDLLDAYKKQLHVSDRFLSLLFRQYKEKHPEYFTDYQWKTSTCLTKRSPFIIIDKKDVIVPYRKRDKLEALFPRSEIFDSNGYGHALVLTNSEAIIKSVDFLTGQNAERELAMMHREDLFQDIRAQLLDLCLEVEG